MSIRVIGPTGEEDVLPPGHPLTLGGALKLFEDRNGISLIPYDGRWDFMPFDSSGERKFIIFNDGGRFGDILVDVYVERRGEEICPKQDLDFPLLDGDLINIGALAC